MTLRPFNQFMRQVLASVSLLSAVLAIDIGEVHAASTFIVADISASMSGSKLEAVREGAKLAVAMLDDAASVQVFAFHNDVLVSPLYRLDQSGSRAEAMTWIDGLQAAGQTNYLKALQAIPLADDAPIIFLSDGEPTVGKAADVLAYLKQNCKARLHTIAIGCPLNSPAEKLLAQMASLTKGSFTRVERSEDLVKTLVRIAARVGKFHRYSPKEEEVPLGIVAPGTLIGFAFDGIPEIEATANTVLYRHHAKLPGEKVNAVVAKLTEPQHVRLKLQKKNGPKARLGDIHLAGAGLPEPKMTLETAATGQVPAGGPLHVKVEFLDRGGQALNLTIHNHLAADIELRGSDGKVVHRVEAKPMMDGQALGATLNVPRVEGPITIRGITSIKLPDGPDFHADEEQTVLAVKPLQLVATPAKLEGSPKIGAFSTTVRVKVDGAAKPVTVAAELDGKPTGLRLIEAKAQGEAVELHFEATDVGVQRGSVLLKADAERPVEPMSIPFEFNIQPKSKGLDLGKVPSISFGTVPAMSGKVGTAFTINSLDNDDFEYNVSTADLSGPSAVVEIACEPGVITPTIKAPAKLQLTATIENVPAGDYSGMLTLRDKSSGMNRQWTVPLKLTVTEPLSAAAIDLGEVEVGKGVTRTITLANRATNPISNVSLSLPAAWQSGDVVTNDIVATLIDTVGELPGKEERSLKFRVLVSPMLKARGRFQGEALIKRGSVEAAKVSITVTVVDEGAGPTLLNVAPNKLAFQSAPGEVVEFSLKCRLADDAEADDELSIAISDTEGPDANLADLTAAFDWPATSKIARRSSAAAKGFLVAPKMPGTYRGTLRVTSRSAGTTIIPFTLVVR